MKISYKDISNDFLTLSQQHEVHQTPVHSDKGSFLTKPDGSLEINYKALDIEGKHSSNHQIKSKLDKNTYSGNPSRYNRSEAVHGLTLDQSKIAVNIAMRNENLSPFTGGQLTQPQSKFNQALIYNGAVISRADMAIMLATGSPSNRDAVLDHIQTLEYKNLEKICYGKNTYFGKDSDSRLCRVYDKSKELRDVHLKKTDEPKYIKRLADYYDSIGAIRIEWEYHRFLRKGDLRYWNNATHSNLCKQFLQDIKKMTQPTQALDFDDIPAAPLGALMMYLAGIDIRKKYNKNTFGKYKKILRKYGYDISNKNIQAIKPKMKTVILTVAEVPDFYQSAEKAWSQQNLSLVPDK